MKWLLIFLLFLIVTIFVGTFLFEYAGFVQIVWLGYDIQLSAVLFLLIIFFLLIVALFLGKLVYLILGLSGRWTSSNNKKAERILIQLLSALEAEKLEEALKLYRRSQVSLAENSLILWVFGNAFEKANQHLEAEKFYVELTKSPATLFLGLKGHIQAALHRGDIIQAYDFLKRAEEINPSSPWVLKHLLALLRKKKRFSEEEALIIRLEDLGILTSDQSKKQIAQSQYEQALQFPITEAQKEAFLRQAHYLDPANSAATEVLASLLSEKGQGTYAATVIEETWAEAPSQRLGDLYLKIWGDKNKKQAFERAQELTQNNPQHPESLLFLARVAIEEKLWGEARKLLKNLLEKSPTADVYQLLARLELKDKKDEKAALSWLEQSLQAPGHVSL